MIPASTPLASRHPAQSFPARSCLSSLGLLEIPLEEIEYELLELAKSVPLLLLADPDLPMLLLARPEAHAAVRRAERILAERRMRNWFGGGGKADTPIIGAAMIAWVAYVNLTVSGPIDAASLRRLQGICLKKGLAGAFSSSTARRLMESVAELPPPDAPPGHEPLLLGMSLAISALDMRPADGPDQRSAYNRQALDVAILMGRALELGPPRLPVGPSIDRFLRAAQRMADGKSPWEDP